MFDPLLNPRKVKNITGTKASEQVPTETRNPFKIGQILLALSSRLNVSRILQSAGDVRILFALVTQIRCRRRSKLFWLEPYLLIDMLGGLVPIGHG